MSQHSSNCILCGRSTPGPVVCYRCFFDYEYRQYKPKEVEDPPPVLKPKKILRTQPDWETLEDDYSVPYLHQKPTNGKQHPTLELPPNRVKHEPGGLWSRLEFS